MKRVLSGIQPTGANLHLGNYFGAVKQFLKLQDMEDTECFFFIANLHALTTISDKDELIKNTEEVAVEYLAFGLDPEKSLIFMQSDVPEVTELTWYFSNVTPVGLLERCHSYKDKIAKGVSPNHGLFTYPVLMASDILIYCSDLVPVGKDQKQHLEVTRDIAQRFNNTYGEVFPLPESLIMGATAEVPGTDGRKMSKTYRNTIDLFAPEKQLKKSIMSVVTDSKGVDDPKEPDTCAPLLLLELFRSEEENRTFREKFAAGGTGYGEVKKTLFTTFMDVFRPVRDKREEILANMDFVRDTLKTSGEKARQVAAETLRNVRKVTGIPAKREA